MRFTAAKEAGNPNAHLVGGVIDGLGVVIKKGAEMAAQFLGDDVLAKLLL